MVSLADIEREQRTISLNKSKVFESNLLRKHLLKIEFTYIINERLKFAPPTKSNLWAIEEEVLILTARGE